MRYRSHVIFKHIRDVSLFLTRKITVEDEREFACQSLADCSWSRFGHNNIRGMHHFWHILYEAKDLNRDMQAGTYTLEVHIQSLVATGNN